MHCTSKGRHAVNALIDLALRQSSGPVALATISSRLQVSLSYLEQLFSRLRRRGIVESTRGPGGGYTLAQPAERITVAEIVTTVDDEVGADDDAGDLSNALWRRLQSTMLDHMAGITLQSLLDEQHGGSPAPAGRAPRPLIAPLPRPEASVARRPRAPNSVFAFGQSFAA